MPDGHRAQKREADFLELEFQTVRATQLDPVVVVLFCFKL